MCFQRRVSGELFCHLSAERLMTSPVRSTNVPLRSEKRAAAEKSARAAVQVVGGRYPRRKCVERRWGDDRIRLLRRVMGQGEVSGKTDGLSALSLCAGCRKVGLSASSICRVFGAAFSEAPGWSPHSRPRPDLFAPLRRLLRLRQFRPLTPCGATSLIKRPSSDDSFISRSVSPRGLAPGCRADADQTSGASPPLPQSSLVWRRKSSKRPSAIAARAPAIRSW